MVTSANLLIVDDEADLREVLSATLGDAFPNYTLAKDGQEAFELLKSSKFHAVLSDINMPRMTGLELLREVRAMGLTTPFVILTAYGDKQKAVDALKLGAFDFLDKPWNNENLFDIVGRALELGLHYDLFSNSPEEIQELNKVHNQSQQSSIEHLQKLVQVMAQENAELKKRIGSA